VFSSNTPLITKATGLNLSTNEIVVSRHVVSDEADSASPRLTNDLDIFQKDDSPGSAPMLASLPAPRVPRGSRHGP
jgi:hypothetical protein